MHAWTALHNPGMAFLQDMFADWFITCFIVLQAQI